jgi:hypothetical protein
MGTSRRRAALQAPTRTATPLRRWAVRLNTAPVTGRSRAPEWPTRVCYPGLFDRSPSRVTTCSTLRRWSRMTRPPRARAVIDFEDTSRQPLGVRCASYGARPADRGRSTRSRGRLAGRGRQARPGRRRRRRPATQRSTCRPGYGGSDGVTIPAFNTKMGRRLTGRSANHHRGRTNPRCPIASRPRDDLLAPNALQDHPRVREKFTLRPRSSSARAVEVLASYSHTLARR